jgi:hypothetical protein
LTVAIIVSYIEKIQSDYECDVQYPNTVNCDTDQSFDIKEELQRISQNLTDSVKHFTEFRLSNAPINELPENTFADITFNEIGIHKTENLTFIHTNAFSGPTANVTQRVFLTQTNKLSNNPTDNDIFAAFSSLVNSESLVICLESNKSHEIPENAFSNNNDPLKNLIEIEFKGDFSISKINNNAFIGLPDLKTWVVFSFIPVEYISAGAFDLPNASNNTMEISFQDCSLTESSFESGVFSGSQRPLMIDLSNSNYYYFYK